MPTNSEPPPPEVPPECAALPPVPGDVPPAPVSFEEVPPSPAVALPEPPLWEPSSLGPPDASLQPRESPAGTRKLKRAHIWRRRRMNSELSLSSRAHCRVPLESFQKENPPPPLLEKETAGPS